MLAPYYDNFTAFSECDSVRFTVSDKVTGAMTDLMIYFWAFMVAIMLAIIFAYLQGAENIWQFFVRVLWYSGEMIIGFGIIMEAIKFIRTLTGVGG